MRCDNKFVGIYREHMSKVKSKIVLGNKKSLDINIIPTLIDPTFGTGLYSFQNISDKIWIMIFSNFCRQSSNMHIKYFF